MEMLAIRNPSGTPVTTCIGYRQIWHNSHFACTLPAAQTHFLVRSLRQTHLLCSGSDPLAAVAVAAEAAHARVGCAQR